MGKGAFFMKRFSEYLFLGALGGSAYYMIEILFRGYSHWSMFLLAGTCMIFFAQQGIWVQWKDPMWRQFLRSMLFLLCGEFITGILVNGIFQWQVWDYSDEPFNLFGQICLLYAVFFSGLCVVGIWCARFVAERVYREETSFLKKKKML